MMIAVTLSGLLIVIAVYLVLFMSEPSPFQQAPSPVQLPP
jgi:hypothetical protein